LAERIAAGLRQRIALGELGPGDALPRERELAEQHGAGRGTVRRALAILDNEGLLDSQHGRGHFVRYQEQLRFPFDAAESRRGRLHATQDIWRSWVESIGRRGDAILSVAVVQPPAHVAAAFGLEPGVGAVVRRRIRLINNEPWMLSNAYFPLSIADGTPLAAAGDLQPGPMVVLRELGHEAVRHINEHRSRMPTPDEAKELRLRAGVPLLEITRISQDRAAVTVRATVNLFPGDRFVITQEIDEDGDEKG
jgi:GntR family transcriptional regulator